MLIIYCRGHTDVIRCVLSKGRYLYSGGSDHSVRIWDVRDKYMKNSKGCIEVLSGHTAEVKAKLNT